MIERIPVHVSRIQMRLWTYVFYPLGIIALSLSVASQIGFWPYEKPSTYSGGWLTLAFCLAMLAFWISGAIESLKSISDNDPVFVVSKTGLEVHGRTSVPWDQISAISLAFGQLRIEFDAPKRKSISIYHMGLMRNELNQALDQIRVMYPNLLD